MFVSWHNKRICGKCDLEKKPTTTETSFHWQTIFIPFCFVSFRFVIRTASKYEFKCFQFEKKWLSQRKSIESMCWQIWMKLALTIKIIEEKRAQQSEILEWNATAANDRMISNDAYECWVFISFGWLHFRIIFFKRWLFSTDSIQNIRCIEPKQATHAHT